MKNNILITSFRNAVFIAIGVMIAIYLLYEWIDVSPNEFRLASGETVSKNAGFFDQFLGGGIYSDVHQRYINSDVVDSFIFSFSFTVSALFLSLVAAVLLFWVILQINVRYYNPLRTIIIILNYIPSYIFQIFLVAIFCFVLNIFPSAYEGDNVVSLLFPLVILNFLFLIHNLFILIQNLTTLDWIDWNYRLNIHRLKFVKQLQFILFSERKRLLYAFQTLLPFVLAGHIFTELIFSLPGYSRLVFSAIREFDTNVVIWLTGIMTFFYSLVYFLTEGEYDR